MPQSTLCPEVRGQKPSTMVLASQLYVFNLLLLCIKLLLPNLEVKCTLTARAEGDYWIYYHHEQCYHCYVYIYELLPMFYIV